MPYCVSATPFLNNPLLCITLFVLRKLEVILKIGKAYYIGLPTYYNRLMQAYDRIFYIPEPYEIAPNEQTDGDEKDVQLYLGIEARDHRLYDILRDLLSQTAVKHTIYLIGHLCRWVKNLQIFRYSNVDPILDVFNVPGNIVVIVRHTLYILMMIIGPIPFFSLALARKIPTQSSFMLLRLASIIIVFDLYCVAIAYGPYFCFLLFVVSYKHHELPSRGFRFKGPTVWTFESLSNQAEYVLDQHFLNWRRYDVFGRSYVIPPFFEYFNSDVSDFAVEKSIAKGQSIDKNRLANRRFSDFAEHLAFKAIRELIKDGRYNPFIAIRGLKLTLDENEDKVIGPLAHLFPNLNWQEYLRMAKTVSSRTSAAAEFDYVIIGARIGIVFIEVKSSSYSNEKHFDKRNRSLPAPYVDGLNQLKLADAFLHLLELCTGAKVPEDMPIRKILFTPFLAKERYDSWFSSLSESDQVRVAMKVGTIRQCFGENENYSSFDLEERGGTITSLRAQVVQNRTPLPILVYESFSEVMAALSLAVVLPSHDALSGAERAELHFSFGRAQESLDTMLKTQNPHMLKKSDKLANGSLLKRATKDVRRFSNLIFLSACQAKALQGPCRQIVMGAAGVGKTVVLQTKALQLLDRNQAVTVLAPQWYMRHYKLLFDRYGFTRYTIKVWKTQEVTLTKSLLDKLAHHMFDDEQIESILIRFVEMNQERLREDFASILFSENIIIDDAFDAAKLDENPENAILSVMLIMAFSQKFCPGKVVWAGVDAYNVYDICYRDGVVRTLTDFLIDHWGQGKGQCCYMELLSEVMRCTESVFNLGYASVRQWIPKISPYLGHKIQGLSDTHMETFSDEEAACAFIIHNIYELTKLPEVKASRNSMAVITGGYDKNDGEHLRNLLRNKCHWPFIFKTRTNDREPAEMSPITALRSNSVDLIIKCWHEVSSMEWPAIAFVTCLPKKIANDQLVRYVEYQKYRAVSRATAIAVTVIAYYQEQPNLPDTFVAKPMDQRDAVASARQINLKANKVADELSGMSPLSSHQALTDV